MKLPFRKQSGGTESNPIIPEMNGPQPQQAARGVMRWVRAAALTVAALIVLWLLFLAGRWAWRGLSQGSDQSTSSHIGNSTANDNNSAQPSGGTPKNGSAASGQSGSQKPASGNASGSQSTGASTLANTGPGSMAGIFAVATATGVVVYQIKLRRAAR